MPWNTGVQQGYCAIFTSLFLSETPQSHKLRTLQWGDRKKFCKLLTSVLSCREAVSTAVSIHSWGSNDRAASSKCNSMETGWCLKAQYVTAALIYMCCFMQSGSVEASFTSKSSKVYELFTSLLHILPGSRRRFVNHFEAASLSSAEFCTNSSLYLQIKAGISVALGEPRCIPTSLLKLIPAAVIFLYLRGESPSHGAVKGIL